MDKRKDFVVRFAGEGGQGVVTASDALARIAAGVGYHVQTFVTFPSQILGGPTYSQTRISTSPVLSPGDFLDVLVALNREAYDNHREEISQDGVLIYDTSFEPDSTERSIGMPFDQLAKEAGDPRTANIVVMGALAALINMPTKYLEDFIVQRFQARGEAIVRANMKAIALGVERVAGTQVKLGTLELPARPTYPQVLVKGNEALALGALAAGMQVYVGYPISPATTILVFMERNLSSPGTFVYQASSEIEAINAVTGAGFAGKKAMTATAGPGFSLMSEGLGMAWMAEIPVVVVDVQRGGPATGLPTKTEQSDLFAAMSPSHGDVSPIVLAPGSVEECFYVIIRAFNLAERCQSPVIVLSEMILSERSQNIPKPDLSKVVVENRKVYEGNGGYQRYDGYELSPMSIPGHPGAYVANASEHDAIGDTTHLPARHIQMTQRRFSKLRLAEKDAAYERENGDEPVALVTWGSSKGPALEAYEMLTEGGRRLGWYYSVQLNPLPPRMLEELRQKELVLVPELNYQGQFASVLRSQGVRAEAITQYTGLPFRVVDLVKEVTARTKAYEKKAVKV